MPSTCHVAQGSPTFWAPGPGFVEGGFSTHGAGGMGQAVTRVMGGDGGGQTKLRQLSGCSPHSVRPGHWGPLMQPKQQDVCPGFFQELGIRCVHFELEPVKNMNPANGLAPVSACDLLASEGPKLHPQSMRMLISEPASHGEACLHRMITSPFSCLQFPFPVPQLYPINNPSPSPSGRQI